MSGLRNPRDSAEKFLVRLRLDTTMRTQGGVTIRRTDVSAGAAPLTNPVIGASRSVIEAKEFPMTRRHLACVAVANPSEASRSRRNDKVEMGAKRAPTAATYGLSATAIYRDAARTAGDQEAGRSLDRVHRPSRWQRDEPYDGTGGPHGTSIVDVTDPKNPRYLAHVPGSLWNRAARRNRAEHSRCASAAAATLPRATRRKRIC